MSHENPTERSVVVRIADRLTIVESLTHAVNGTAEAISALATIAFSMICFFPYVSLSLAMCASAFASSFVCLSASFSVRHCIDMGENQSI